VTVSGQSGPKKNKKSNKRTSHPAVSLEVKYGGKSKQAKAMDAAEETHLVHTKRKQPKSTWWSPPTAHEERIQSARAKVNINSDQRQ